MVKEVQSSYLTHEMASLKSDSDVILKDVLKSQEKYYAVIKATNAHCYCLNLAYFDFFMQADLWPHLSIIKSVKLQLHLDQIYLMNSEHYSKCISTTTNSNRFTNFVR